MVANIISLPHGAEQVVYSCMLLVKTVLMFAGQQTKNNELKRGSKFLYRAEGNFFQGHESQAVRFIIKLLRCRSR